MIKDNNHRRVCMLLSELLRSAGIFYRAEGDENIEITKVTSDSRSAGENSLFVCIRGRNHDGHSFAKEAVAKGAVAILAEDGLPDLPSRVTVIYTPDSAAANARLWDAWYSHPARDMKLIAVTGTNGKTTTCFMLDAIFSSALCKCGIIGTVYCRTPKKLVEIPEGRGGMTTPEPDVLYGVLEEMRRDGAEYVFIEATSHALALGRLAPLSFEAAIFTNLTSEHLYFTEALRIISLQRHLSLRRRDLRSSILMIPTPLAIARTRARRVVQQNCSFTRRKESGKPITEPRA